MKNLTEKCQFFSGKDTTFVELTKKIHGKIRFFRGRPFQISVRQGLGSGSKRHQCVNERDMTHSLWRLPHSR